MSHEPNWYQALGLEPGATPEEIKRAFRAKARLTHEDRTQTLSPEARTELGRQYCMAVAAYKVLADPMARAKYDRRFAPVRTLRDLLLRPSGERVGAQLFARGSKEPGRGEDLLATAVVPAADWRPGGMITLVVGAEAVRVPVPTDLERRWLRFNGMGMPGSNGGSAGDLFVSVLVK